MQADTWDPSPGTKQQAIVDRIEERTAAFDGHVLLFQGDSHVFKADNPLGLDNFARIVVHGETLPFEYPRLTIDPRDPSAFPGRRIAASAPRSRRERPRRHRLHRQVAVALAQLDDQVAARSSWARFHPAGKGSKKEVWAREWSSCS